MGMAVHGLRQQHAHAAIRVSRVHAAPNSREEELRGVRALGRRLILASAGLAVAVYAVASLGF